MTVEPQGWGELAEGLGAPILRVLAVRRGLPTLVRMANGEELLVYDGSGWGRDFGDLWEHVLVRLTPLDADRGDNDHDLIWLSEVESLLDPETRTVLISQVPRPGET